MYYTPVLWYSIWVNRRGSWPTTVKNRRTSNVFGQPPVFFFLPADYSSGVFDRWGGRLPKGCFDWLARHGPRSAFPSAIRSTRSGMYRRCTHLTLVARYLCRCRHPPRPSIASSTTTRPYGNSKARPPPLSPVCLVSAILHIVQTPRNLTVTARPPNVALCGGVDRHPHWQPRHVSSRSAAGSTPCGQRPPCAVLPTQSPPQSLRS